MTRPTQQPNASFVGVKPHSVETMSYFCATCVSKSQPLMIEPKLLPIQSKLRGFTEKSSSLNTAFIVTRAAEYCRETSDELYIITLDAQKAFDRLNHELLFNKLYHDGICGDLWILLRNTYREVSVKVKWDNNLSRKVDVAQGIRQGEKLSTILYKRYNNNILEALERSGMGAQI